MDAGQLSQEIQSTHHALLRTELPRVSAGLRATGSPKVNELWTMLDDLLVDHLAKEENILFPAIEHLVATGKAEGCPLDGPVLQLRHEHHQMERIMGALRERADEAGATKGAMIAVLDDLDVHAGREERELFPEALRLASLGHPAVIAADRAEAYHKHLQAVLDRLDAAFAARDLTPRLGAPWRHFAEGMRDHMRVEEQVLFPAVRALAALQDPGDADWRTPLAEMQFELDELRTIFDALRSAAPEAGDLEGQLLTLLDELEEHARREEEQLQPAAQELVERWQRMHNAAIGQPTTEETDEPAPPPRAPHAHPQAPFTGGLGGDAGDGVLFRVLRRLFRAGRRVVERR